MADVPTSVFDMPTPEYTSAPRPQAPTKPFSVFDEPTPSSGPANPVLNAATSAVSSVAEPLSNLALRGVNAVGGMSDADLQNAIHTHPLAYDLSRTSGKIGAGLGMAATAYGSGGLAAPAVFGAEGGENAYENVESRRAAGQHISSTDAALNVAGHTALMAGIGLASPAGRLGGGFLKAANPTLAGSVARTVAGATIGAGEMVGVGRLGSQIQRATGVDPNPQENDVENAIQGAIFHGVPQIGREVGGGMNALEAARQRTGTDGYDAQGQALPEPGTTAARAQFDTQAQQAATDYAARQAQNQTEIEQAAAAQPPRTEPYDVGNRPQAPDEIASLEQRMRLQRAKETGRMDATKAETLPPELEAGQAAEAQRKALIDAHEKAAAAAVEAGQEPPPPPQLPENPYIRKGGGDWASDNDLDNKLEAFEPKEPAERRVAEQTYQREPFPSGDQSFQTPEEAAPSFFQKKAAEQAARDAEVAKPADTGLTRYRPPPSDVAEPVQPTNALSEARQKVETSLPDPDAGQPVVEDQAAKEAAAKAEDRRLAAAYEAKQPVVNPAATEAPNPLIESQQIASEPAEAPPADETFFQKLAREGKKKLKELAADEEGGEVVMPFIHQDVVPTIRKGVAAVSDTLSQINRAENLGFGTPTEAKSEALKITKALADAKIEGRAVEAAVAPHLASVPKFADDRAGALHYADQVEATGEAPGDTPGTPHPSQPAVDLLAELDKQILARGEKLGLKLKDLKEEGGQFLSRQFHDPSNPGKKGGSTVQGDTSSLISQKYTTFSDAFNAAERKGLVPDDPDPLTMQIRAKYEMLRILGLREQLHASEDGGSVAWSPGEERVPEGHSRIEDRIADQTRRQANPDWVVAKYAKGVDTEGGFDKERWLDENKKNMVHVRPGDDAPEGYSFNGRKTEGYYHAGDETARMWNNATAKGVTDPLAKIPGKIAQAAVKFRYDMSPVHAINGLVQHLNYSTWQALRNIPKLWGGAENVTPLGDVIRDLNIFGSRTNEVLGEIAKPGTGSPELQDMARHIQQGGNDISVSSVLDKPAMQPAMDAFKSGNWQGGILRTLDGARQLVKNGTYKSILNRIAATQARQGVEEQTRAGVTGEEGQAATQQAADVVNRALGRHVDSPNFKNSIIKEAGKLMAPAWTYRVGLLKNIAASMAGNPYAQRLVLGTLVNTMVGGAATMAALTYANTGSVQLPQDVRDYWNPRTGRKDDNGHEERITFGPAAFGARMIGLGGTKGIADELKGSLNPAITGAVETAENKDYSGNQIRPEGGGFFGNLAKGAAHVGRGMVPMSVSSQYSSPQGEEPGIGTRIAKEFGVGVGHPVTSDAEQVLYDAIGSNQKGGRTPEQQSAHDNERKWVAEIRGGQSQQASEEMSADPSMSESKMRSVFHRASAKKALEGLVHDPQLTPQVLLKAWNAGSDEDHGLMKAALQERIGRARPGNAQEAGHWQNLSKAIGG